MLLQFWTESRLTKSPQPTIKSTDSLVASRLLWMPMGWQHIWKWIQVNRFIRKTVNKNVLFNCDWLISVHYYKCTHVLYFIFAVFLIKLWRQSLVELNSHISTLHLACLQCILDSAIPCFLCSSLHHHHLPVLVWGDVWRCWAWLSYGTLCLVSHHIWEETGQHKSWRRGTNNLQFPLFVSVYIKTKELGVYVMHNFGSTFCGIESDEWNYCNWQRC